MYQTPQERWTQFNGDSTPVGLTSPRKQSLFDDRIDELLKMAGQLLTRLNVFHLKIHFSNNQLACWTYDNPYAYVVFAGEEVFDRDFSDHFNRLQMPLVCDIHASQVAGILAEFKRLRMVEQGPYLHAASINRVNGLIELSFSCDSSHYLPHQEFCESIRMI